MRYLFIILLFLSTGAFAQKRADLEKAVTNLDMALLNKDSVMLKMLLSDQLSYGHSNGWIESKHDVIQNLFNGKLTYRQINKQSQEMAIDGGMAAVRMVIDVDVEMNGKAIQLKLSVLQVWVWKNKHWALFARQSTKV